jgi:hypothetical protein
MDLLLAFVASSAQFSVTSKLRMSNLGSVGRSVPNEALWRRITAHPFENPSHDMDFVRRLAREESWCLSFARGAIEEYRRFAFLCVTETSPMTPSEEVDQVWHLHLTFSRDYWDVWCGEVLPKKLHHDPTQGGPIEQARYRNQYGATLAAYERHFGPPPAAYWPSTYRRFRNPQRFRKVDAERVFVVIRPRLPGWGQT